MKSSILFVLLVFILTIASSKITTKATRLFSLKRHLKSKQTQLTQQKQHDRARTRLGRDERDIELAQYSNDIYNGCPTGAALCTEYPLSVLFAVLQVPDSSKCFMIVRGTQNIDNWMTDLDLPLVTNPYGDGMVHQGFLTVMQKIEGLDQYNPLIDQCVTNGWYIGFAGHSLGAAVATLATQQFYQRHSDYTNFHYATFGSPRVGNYDFQQDFITKLPHMGNRYESVQSDTTSYLGLVHSSPCGNGAIPGDIIPRVPPMTPLARKISEWIVDISVSTFWSGSSDDVKSFLGLSDDDDDSRANGYRHVGYRFQVSCDDPNLINCHSITNTYLPALVSDDATLVRDC